VWRGLRPWLLLAGGIGCAFVATSFVLVDQRVQAQFGQTQWRIPTRVFTQPVVLHAGRSLSREGLERELEALGYRRSSTLAKPGHYRSNGRTVEIQARAFDFADGRESARRLRVRFAEDTIAAVWRGGDEAARVRLEPQRIGQVYAGRRADRILVRRDDVPPLLIEALLAVEDRDFFDHWGVQPTAIARAAWANLRAGEIVQGGSTLTQQLAKNFFLSSERTFARKYTEALMAVSLEWRYSKEALLEAYLNEVYLGQAGRRSIHGFGLAAQHWFNRPVGELDLAELALLVGMIRGPSYYDPRQKPQRARQRRNTVLRVLARTGTVKRQRARAAMDTPLAVVDRETVELASYPAYLDLARRHLAQRYSDEDLAAGGLRVYTHLRVNTQRAAERGLARRLDRLDGDGDLQGAAIVAAADSGAVEAILGSRSARRGGYNRATRARRPIGSLIKPAIYYTALQRPERYTLATPVRDEAVTVERRGGEPWQPRNFDGEFLGRIPLYRALVESRNGATARVGLDLGLERVGRTLERLRVADAEHIVPADLLGSISLTPLEVARMYQTLAAGGFDAPLRTIRAVRTREGDTLAEPGLQVERSLDPAVTYLVSTTLERVAREGTARALQRLLPQRRVAGKTGTTNERRDSWFAGFDGRRVGVVWVGHDDNSPTGLTGSAGALRVWADMMQRLPVRPWRHQAPPGVTWAHVSADGRSRVPSHCDGAVRLPFLEGSQPRGGRGCRSGHGRGRTR